MNEKWTIADICKLKTENRKFACLTCYDFTTAQIISDTDVEMVMVGDSAAQVMLGFESTLQATMDFMVAITAGVRRGAPKKLLVADMPFLSYQTSLADAVRNAGRFFVESGADIVKIEANREQLNVVKAVSDAGMAVMAHIGIRPQTIAKTGKLRAEGVLASGALELLDLAKAMVSAGASIILLEGTSREVAKEVTQILDIPVLSCGAGPDCDGQVLVLTDVIGTHRGVSPKFSKTFADCASTMKTAFQTYSDSVHAGNFPDDDHSYHMKSQDLEAFLNMLKNN